MNKKTIKDLNKEEEQRALDLHKNAVVIDACYTSFFDEKCFQGDRYRDEFLPMLKRGGVTAILATLFVSQNLHQACNKIVNLWKLEERNKDSTVLANSAGDIKKAKEEGKVAVVFGSQGIGPMEEDLNLLAVLHSLGIRCMQLTYQERNLIGDGCGERTNCGLSRFGVELCEEMNRLGILIDLSHAGNATSMDAIEFSKDPVCFTHTGAHALNDHCRCISDDLIKAMAEKGGVMGFTSNSQFLKLQGWAKGDVTIEDYLDHIDYVTNLVGVDYVGIGLDASPPHVRSREEWGRELLDVKYPELFGNVEQIRTYDWTKKYAEGLKGVSELHNVTRGLVARGYSDKEILKVLGGNWIRIMGKVCST